MNGSAAPPATRSIAWSGYRDPAARRRAASGARPPIVDVSQDQALELATELRQLGLTGATISRIMGHCLGHWAPAATWLARIRRGS